MVDLVFQLTAAAYLLAGVLAGGSLALSNKALARASVVALGAGALLHGYGFSILHTADPTPPLTDAPTALSFMAWVGTVAFLALLARFRLRGLIVMVGPLAFLTVFYVSHREPQIAAAEIGAGSLPHAHVLLASAGLALLGLAGMAGGLYLTEHRRLKRKRTLIDFTLWPSLEALDRVNALTLAIGFPLLTLGVVTGAMWVQSMHGRPFTGASHETWSLVAWAIYGVLVALRFGVGQGAWRCAANAMGGFAFAGVAIIGLELFV